MQGLKIFSWKSQKNQPLCREGKAGAAAAPGGVVPHTRKKIKKGFNNVGGNTFLPQVLWPVRWVNYDFLNLTT